ncbi:hypothetical protein HPB47_011991 [Ixodes persulcatus]|uniref:Uncharacterized protein n=1 Tax=Ixodes persulcatus TaxID=34615 RepID=A0AC60NUX8_IXOPE|nr:hypothetical protein HPB47_011991 [Ixodes persulcatus]
MVVSTPVLENAQRYRGIVEILLDGKRFGVAAYATPPENTAKGVIHEIPEEDTEEDINGNLIGARNPSILQARRMGRSGSVVIVFEGRRSREKVKGLLDAEPTGRTCVHAGVRGMRQGAPHGRPKVQKEVQDAVHRTAEKLGKETEQAGPPEAGRGELSQVARGRLPLAIEEPCRGTEIQSGSRSGKERHVSWAEMVSRKAPQNKGGNAFAETGQANELAEIKALLKQALAENKALREELNRLKEGTRERVEVVHAPEETISAESDGGESASPPLKRRARFMTRPRREAREAKPVSGDQETFVTKNMLESAITGCTERMLTALQSRASRLAHGTPNPLDAWAHYTRVTGNITRPETEAMINEDGSEPGDLQQYINHKEEGDRPDVVALQEPKRLAKLSGYKSYGKDAQDKTLVTTMVKRNIPVIEHETGKLAALGLHNTVEEIIEAQRVSQLERLMKSATGRHILASLGIRYERQTGEKADVPRRVREALVIPNIPKHMHPTHHAERRAARVKRLRYPPAHPSLDKRTSVAWRRLQTGSFPSPSLLNKCTAGHVNLRHMVWECSRIDRKSHPLLEKIDNQESW